jgi:hypothetical protein
MMHRHTTSIAVALLTCLALSACGPGNGSAKQDSLTWAWQYSGVGADGAPITASGVLRTDRDPDGDGWFMIERIRGHRNGVRITGLYPAGEAIPSNVDPSTGVPYAGDNLLRPSEAGAPHLDKQGFQFSLADGTYSNVFFASFEDPPTYLEFHSVPPFPAGAVSPNTELPMTFSAELQRTAE